MGAAWVARGRRKDELIRRGARRRRVRCAATLAIRSRGRVKRRRAALGCGRGAGALWLPLLQPSGQSRWQSRHLRRPAANAGPSMTTYGTYPLLCSSLSDALGCKPAKSENWIGCKIGKKKKASLSELNISFSRNGQQIDSNQSFRQLYCIYNCTVYMHLYGHIANGMNINKPANAK